MSCEAKILSEKASELINPTFMASFVRKQSKDIQYRIKKQISELSTYQSMDVEIEWNTFLQVAS